MKNNQMLAATVALALAAPATLLAQGAGHEQHHGGAAQAAPEAAPQEAPQGGMMGGGMMEDGQMPPEMQERMRQHMQEVMRPMLREIIRDVMIEIATEGLDASADATADAPDTEGHGAHHAEAAPTGSPATEAYRAANVAMHEAMDIEFTDDPDIDFARGMIGHHEGAIDMARIVLEHGDDPELRQLAEEVIEAQEAEIEFLRDWLAERDG
jgi:uncharacterized protein (DUF305 family)